jgi:hypothetical protein
MTDLAAALRPLSDEAIQTLTAVAHDAAEHLREGPAVSMENLAFGGGLNNQNIQLSLEKRQTELKENYAWLAKEPAISRVVAEDQHGVPHTFYICRAGGGIRGVVGRNAPMGRLASLDIGDELGWHETTYTVIERAGLKPRKSREGWDSIDSLIETETLGPITVPSLRAFLSGDELLDSEHIDDLVAQIQAAASQDRTIFEGRRRNIVEKMTLRDQPILDKFQDEIFRLPLNHRLVLLGPPGTGKTTTLIRRLGQKVNLNFLQSEELGLLAKPPHGSVEEHAGSWVMFTPTQLLKHYLKEAFAREGVPASDHRIKTWDDHRLDLARNHFGILRNASGRGAFTLKSRTLPLDQAALGDIPAWFDDFDAWQRAKLLEEFRKALDELKRAAECGLQGVEMSQAVTGLVGRLQNLLDAGEPRDMVSKVEAILIGEGPRLQALGEGLRTTSEQMLKDGINRLLNRDKTLLTDLARFLGTLAPGGDLAAEEGEDSLAEDDEEEETSGASAQTEFSALTALRGALRSKIRLGAVEPPRAVGRNSRAGKLLAWLEERGAVVNLDPAVLGPMLTALAAVREFNNPVRRHLNGLPRRYRTFRRERQKEGRWYCPDGFESGDIHPLEVDGVLLAMLREAGELLRRSHVRSQLGNQAGWALLHALDGQHRNQVVVDEATDFSPVQLACMAALASPRTQSFFACGDFNQRLTTWGARSSEALAWAVPSLEFRQVSITYRQSRQLNELAHALAKLSGSAGTLPELPRHVDAEGVAPALLEGAGTEETVAWLAQRIGEIERLVGHMPSTAIFVNSEAEVVAMAQQLNDRLEAYNLQATACHEGQSLGQEGNIRVFDIRHIKGLEFEAVFFVGIDRLAALHPDLLDKFLYVGTTRAATYLGLTCETALPPAIEPLRGHFVPDWAQARLAPARA